MTKTQKMMTVFSWAMLIGAVLVFGFAIFKTSPYRTLRPYWFFGARLNSESESGNDTRIVTIPVESSFTWHSFKIDQRPVTIRAYQRCVDSGVCFPPHYRGHFLKYIENPLYREFPVTYVSVEEAQLYCEWLGGTLPSEQQWKDAAGAMNANIYPWGDREPSLSTANYDGLYQGLIPSGWLPVGASPFGVLDLAGNVREWVSDTLPNPNPEWGDENILKGGGASDFPNQLELAERQTHAGSSAGFNRGFRCVYPAESSGSGNHK